MIQLIRTRQTSFRPRFSAHSRCCLLRLFLPLVCLPVSAWSAEEETATSESEPASETVVEGDSGLPFGLGWLEDTQRASSQQVNALADKIDRFLGVPRSDLEAAYSSLRFSVNNEWTEADGSDQFLRLRGRVYLPRLNERISLVFSEDQGEGEDVYNNQAGGGADPEETRVNVEVNLDDEEDSRLDFRVGLRSNLKLRTSMRYRLDSELSDRLSHRLTQTFQFVDGRGFGSITRSEFNRQLSDTTLFRWTNDLRLEEEFNGAEMNSEVRWIKRVDEQSVLTTFFGIDAETNPDFVSAYYTGFRFRQAIYKTWLFAEIEPKYVWFKEEFQDRREGQLSFLFRIEMAIGKLD